MTIDEQIEILRAYRNGNRIQVRCYPLGTTWYDVTENERFNFQTAEYRIVPELVPWTAEDVPMPILFIRQKGYHSFALVDHFRDDGLNARFYAVNKEFLSFKELFENYVHSTDGKTWLPCGKEKNCLEEVQK